jgi:hypothetical protein
VGEPAGEGEDGRAAGDVVDEDRGGGAAVVGPGDGAEAFLTG